VTLPYEYYQVEALVCAPTATGMGRGGYSLGHCDECRTGIWISVEDADLSPHLQKVCVPCARHLIEPEMVIGRSPTDAVGRRDHAETYAQGQR